MCILLNLLNAMMANDPYRPTNLFVEPVKYCRIFVCSRLLLGQWVIGKWSNGLWVMSGLDCIYCE